MVWDGGWYSVSWIGWCGMGVIFNCMSRVLKSCKILVLSGYILSIIVIVLSCEVLYLSFGMIVVYEIVLIDDENEVNSVMRFNPNYIFVATKRYRVIYLPWAHILCSPLKMML